LAVVGHAELDAQFFFAMLAAANAIVRAFSSTV
jgi:hypothetical protein